MVERSGRVRATVIPNRSSRELDKAVGAHALLSSMVFTDDWKPYGPVGQRFMAHQRIPHSAGVYVDGNVHTNTIEGWFGLMKNGIRGVYHVVSREYLQNYLDEFAFRYNHRNSPEPLFWATLRRV